MVYYSESDPFAAAWLRNLVTAGLLPAGDVDDRDIKKVQPEDLKGYDACHWFCGIGGWPLAGRMAGLPDDFRWWSGSCPCQGFSDAGARLGFADERHLWPLWFNILRERRPQVIFGEQVASAIRYGWIDIVCSDLAGVPIPFS